MHLIFLILSFLIVFMFHSNLHLIRKPIYLCVFASLCMSMYTLYVFICICSRSFHPDRVLHALTSAPLILAVYMAVYVSVLSHRIRNYAELYLMAFLYPLIIDLTSWNFMYVYKMYKLCICVCIDFCCPQLILSIILVNLCMIVPRCGIQSQLIWVFETAIGIYIYMYLFLNTYLWF